MNWNNLFNQKLSERDARLGKKAREYITQKYVSLFARTVLSKPVSSILELGAGRGEITHAILTQMPKRIKRYVATELLASGVKDLRKSGVDARQMDAQNLRFPKSSFDIVAAFDVMHHVPDPSKMALEMTRVSKKYVFLIEANGLSLPRKLMEKTAWYKSLGENSYLPWQYRSFFPQKHFRTFSIHPFLFVPPGIPDSMSFIIPPISEALERIPLLNWQCSGVVMFGVKK